MAHSYPNILVHCVFSTKERRDVIPKEIREQLWKYLSGIAKNYKIGLIEAGGTGNHVHLLMALPSDMTLAKAVQVLKANSSRWMREHKIDFTWQEGYGAFSVSASNRETVRKYISKQEEHHRRRSFEEEFVLFLKKCGVPYDSRFVFG